MHICIAMVIKNINRNENYRRVKFLLFSGRTDLVTVGIIDLNFLKRHYTSGRLKNAHIFAELFQIKHDSKFKQNGKIFDFLKWHVTFSDWHLFVTFLKYGEIHGNLQLLEQLNSFCHKIGGVPCFDRYYESVHCQQKDYQTKNVILPHQDIDNIYKWIIIKYWEYNKLQRFYKTGWIPVSIFTGNFVVLRKHNKGY